MKYIIILFLLLIGKANSQSINASKIRVSKEDSTVMVTSGDTSFVYNARIISTQLSGISTISLTCKVYNDSNSTWTIIKDTAYSWNLVTASSHNNISYKACGVNPNIKKICLGRVDFTLRRKFIFTVTGSNGVLTKEFIF